jgi:hypothetical protein
VVAEKVVRGIILVPTARCWSILPEPESSVKRKSQVRTAEKIKVIDFRKEKNYRRLKYSSATP